MREAGARQGELPPDPQHLLEACDRVLARQLRRIAVPMVGAPGTTAGSAHSVERSAAFSRFAPGDFG